MKKNYVKEKLRRGEVSYGTWLSLGDLCATRVLARMGFDWLTLDIEHSAIDWSQAAMIFAAIADAGCVPLARVPEGNHHLIKRVLDGGAMGIVVPMVDTVEQAKAAIAAAYYPPVGNRSVGGGMHAMNFGTGAGEYYSQANDNILVVLQTESPRGVTNAEAIYSLPGVDAIFIGPNDLLQSMGKTPSMEVQDREFVDALRHLRETAVRHGVAPGLHTGTADAVKRRLAEGWKLLAIGSDLGFLTGAAQAAVREIGLAPSRETARY